MGKIITSLEDLENEAARFARGLVRKRGEKREGATLVTLSGDLGAGKTAFVKAVARAFHIEETVNSPTFILEKIYTIPQATKTDKSFKRLVHIDAYRLEKGSDLDTLGFDEIMQDVDNLILLEWPERVSEALTSVFMQITITPLPDGSRKILYE